MNVSIWVIKKKQKLPTGHVLVNRGRVYSLYRKKLSDYNVDYRLVENETGTHYYQIRVQSPDPAVITNFENVLLQFLNYRGMDKRLLEEIEKKVKIFKLKRRIKL
mgnify:CR=1 FL=1